MPRKLKDAVYQKPWERTLDRAKEERDLAYGRVRDYYGNKKVELFWNLDADAIENKLFRLKIGKEEVILDAEEVMKFLRWV